MGVKHTISQDCIISEIKANFAIIQEKYETQPRPTTAFMLERTYQLIDKLTDQFVKRSYIDHYNYISIEISKFLYGDFPY